MLENDTQVIVQSVQSSHIFLAHVQNSKLREISYSVLNSTGMSVGSCHTIKD